MFDEADVLSDLDQLRSRYEILRRLGVDGSEPVYAARIRGTDRHFAVKVMTDRARRPASPGALHGWQAHNIEPLEHPKLMTMHAVHHLQGGAVAVAVERRRGRTLAERLRSADGMTPEEAERVLRDVAEALAYLHGRGVVHRSVRPESIFLDRDAGCARLAHFGLEAEGSADAPDRALRYLAPEQLKDGAAVDGRRVCPATDLFSLGVTGWELLSGRHPAEAGSGSGGKWWKGLAGALAEACPRARPDLVAALEACLEANPGKRPANASEFLALLDDPRLDATAPGRRGVSPVCHPGVTPVRHPGEGRDPAAAPGAADEPRRRTRQNAEPSRPGWVTLNLPKLHHFGPRRGRRRPDRPLAASTSMRGAGMGASREDTPNASVGGAAHRAPQAAILLPAISLAAIASVLVALQLRSESPLAESRLPEVLPPSRVDLETRGAGRADLDADLDILEKSGSSSYRVRLQAEPPAHEAAKADAPRTPSRQQEAVSGGEPARSPDIPATRLRDQGGVSGGLVLLGEPIRR